MQRDLADAVRWAAARGVADPARVCAFGGSYGGYAALAALAFEPGLYACAVAVAGVADGEPRAGPGGGQRRDALGFKGAFVPCAVGALAAAFLEVVLEVAAATLALW